MNINTTLFTFIVTILVSLSYIYSNVVNVLQNNTNTNNTKNTNQMSINKRSLGYLIDLNSETSFSTQILKYEDLTKILLNKGQRVFSINKLMSYNVNEKEKIRVTLSTMNSEIGSDIYNLVGVYKDNTLLSSGSDYYVNYTLSNNTYYAQEYGSNYLPSRKNNYLAECEYQAGDIFFDHKFYKDFPFSVIKKFRTGSFAIKENEKGLWFITYNNGTLQINDIEGYLNNTIHSLPIKDINIIDLHVIDQAYEQLTYLALIDDRRIVYIMSINSNSYGELFNIQYYTKIHAYEDFEAVKVTKIGHSNNHFLIGSNNGFFVYGKKTKIQERDSEGNIINVNTTSIHPGIIDGIDLSNYQEEYEITRKIKTFLVDKSFTKDLYVQDFVILQSHIYILAYSYGFLIMESNSFGFTPYVFEHSNVKSLDLYVNPILNTKYVGLALYSNSEENDFLIELNCDIETNPKVNKIFVGEKNLNYDNMLLNDLFFSYVYDKYENTLLLIRRGMINNIPNKTFKLNLNNIVDSFNIQAEGTTKLISLFNSENNKNEVGLLIKGNMYIFEDVSFEDDKLECRFNKDGRYNITLNKYGEACEDSLKHNYAFSYCSHVVYLNINSIGPDMTDLIVLAIVLGCLGSLVALIFIVLCLVKTACCTDFSMFRGGKRKHIPTREELYRDNFLINNIEGFDDKSILGTNRYSTNMNNSVAMNTNPNINIGVNDSGIISSKIK